ncbi:alpha/beta fold hydrolase [Calycomorphotria hydatis]|uniref:Phospholipase YtpA n=1 Tax=Calycomorphotria hydatis TaxID=2528027 RepID=A0A517T4E1_9PLAN|nr:alpha/beta fold hydrolase [Calycomorphotria hydatis]QDT63246.1 Phospholipase YtpA [Calycomorphotria hydatis]
MSVAQSFVTSFDGTSLFVREYVPATSENKSLMLLHGATVHGGRLDPLARFFQERGYRVIVPDLRGHGRSDGCPMHVRIFDEYVEDIETIRAERLAGEEPSAILGVSMGGLIAVRHVQRFAGHFRSMGLVSPLLGLGFPLPSWLLAAGRVLSWIHPRTRFRSILKPEEVSKSPIPVAGEGADPLIHRSVTAGWYFAMRAALSDAWAERAHIHCPVTVVQAERDCVVDPEASRQWSSIFASLSSRRRVFRMLRGHCHDLLGEPNWTRAAKLFAGRMTRDLEREPNLVTQLQLPPQFNRPSDLARAA